MAKAKEEFVSAERIARLVQTYGPKVDLSKKDAIANETDLLDLPWSWSDKGNLVRSATALEELVILMGDIATALKGVRRDLAALKKQLKPMTDDARFVAFVAEANATKNGKE